MSILDSETKVALVSLEHQLGGAERSLLELARGLRRSDSAHCHVLCPINGAWKDFLSQDKIPHSEMKVWKPMKLGGVGAGVANVGAVVYNSLSILFALKRLKPALVHANGQLAALFCVIATRMLGLPCVWHVRDFPHRQWLTKLLCCCCDSIVCPSNFIRESILACVPGCEPKLVVTYNPVSAKAWMSCLSDEVAADHPFTFLMVAQIVPWKGQDLYISAAGVLASKYPLVSFVHIGTDMSGYNSGYYEQLKSSVRKIGLQDRFYFAEFTQDIQSAVSRCDVVVLPSKQEPFGRVVVEAWIAGKPVIVSDCGGPAELVTHGINGLVFASGNAAELAASMEEMSQDATLRHRLGAAGKAKARQFNADNHTRDICRVYERLLV